MRLTSRATSAARPRSACSAARSSNAKSEAPGVWSKDRSSSTRASAARSEAVLAVARSFLKSTRRSVCAAATSASAGSIDTGAAGMTLTTITDSGAASERGRRFGSPTSSRRRISYLPKASAGIFHRNCPACESIVAPGGLPSATRSLMTREGIPAGGFGSAIRNSSPA